MPPLAWADVTVSAEDRRRFERQVAALREEENDDEGTPEWRASVIAWANRERAKRGDPPLKEWWEDKGELELHKRARALGLLGRVR